jgi:hypothetical protein
LPTACPPPRHCHCVFARFDAIFAADAAAADAAADDCRYAPPRGHTIFYADAAMLRYAIFFISTPLPTPLADCWLTLFRFACFRHFSPAAIFFHATPSLPFSFISRAISIFSFHFSRFRCRRFRFFASYFFHFSIFQLFSPFSPLPFSFADAFFLFFIFIFAAASTLLRLRRLRWQIRQRTSATCVRKTPASCKT